MNNETNLPVVVIGGGPAGLAAAYELSKNNIKTLLFEKEDRIGGLAKTFYYKGYYFDAGGHRFVTRSKQISKIWQELLPNKDFLKKKRLSRIYYKDKLFSYPINIFEVLTKISLSEFIAIIKSYFFRQIHPHKDENIFKNWVENRFGDVLYKNFFKDYTEKVWGLPAEQLSSDWAALTISKISLSSLLKNIIKNENKPLPYSIAKEFFYPRYGPGMLYEALEKRIKELGTEIYTETEVVLINYTNKKCNSIIVKNIRNNLTEEIPTRAIISTMPITNLIKRLRPKLDKEIINAADELSYRNFITVNFIIDKANLFPDNWIYIPSKELKMARIQNYKNWSNSMCKEEDKTNIGVEYFCSSSDKLWHLSDEELVNLAKEELKKLKFLNLKEDKISDAFVVRLKDAYPIYKLSYKEKLEVLKQAIIKFDNLWTVGREGLFVYNQMAHAIFSGLFAARSLSKGIKSSCSFFDLIKCVE